MLSTSGHLRDAAVKTDDIVRPRTWETTEHAIANSAEGVRAPTLRGAIEHDGASVEVRGSHRFCAGRAGGSWLMRARGQHGGKRQDRYGNGRNANEGDPPLSCHERWAENQTGSEGMKPATN
jgi:hypothetical protein